MINQEFGGANQEFGVSYQEFGALSIRKLEYPIRNFCTSIRNFQHLYQEFQHLYQEFQSNYHYPQPRPSTNSPFSTLVENALLPNTKSTHLLRRMLSYLTLFYVVLAFVIGRRIMCIRLGQRIV